jgi:hypothetical protein
MKNQEGESYHLHWDLVWIRGEAGKSIVTIVFQGLVERACLATRKARER